MSEVQLQYISDENGDLKGVIVPIELWRELVSELETSYLLKSEKMRQRLLESKNRSEGIPLGAVLEKLGVGFQVLSGTENMKRELHI